MRELVKSWLSFANAMPLFGAQQLGYWLSPTPERRRQAAAGLEAVSRAAAQGVDRQGLLGFLQQLGSCAEQTVLQVTPTLITPELLSPKAWADVAMEAAARSAVAARQVATGKGLLALDMVRYKAQVFCLVLDVAKLIGEPESPPFPLYDLLGKAYGLGLFPALWAIEGLGHDYSNSFWAQGITPHAILRDARTSELPPSSLTMLDAGIGLSFAQHTLADVAWQPPEPELRALVAEIVRLCRDNARPGYVGAPLENMGLVTQTFHAHLVPAVDQALRQTAPEVLGYYWHGVGRAMFFAPINFLPGSDGLLFEMAAATAPDEPARLSAVAGAAWGYVLVAQQAPAIVAELLIAPYGESLARDGAFANGVASAMMMRFDTTPDAPFIQPFLQYRTGPPGSRLAELWDQLIRIPGETALGTYYPVIKRHNRLGDIFEYRDLAAFVARLQKTGGRAPA